MTADIRGGRTVAHARAVMFAECTRGAADSLRANAFRSILTMLGITIGVAAVLAVVGLVNGLTTSIGRQFAGLGSDVLTARADTSLEDRLRERVHRLRIEDLEAIRRDIAGIEDVTPLAMVGARLGTEVRHGASATSVMLLGTTASYQEVRHAYPAAGRFLTVSDEKTRRRVVVLGDKTRRDLRLPSDPTGTFVLVGSEWFKVIGVMEPRGDLFGVSQDDFVLMPFATALSLRDATQAVDLSISFRASDPAESDAIKARTSALLRRLHGLARGEADDFAVEAADTLRKSFAEITGAITAVVAAIVGISLLVGGVGIMNIMLVSVRERTREIGILKALGAPRSAILLQFLMEAGLLATTGGAVGVVLGYSAAWGLSALIPDFPPPQIPGTIVAGALAFASFIGLVFGILPASHAANLAPADALRYE